ncbi:hypothetical protein ADK52_19035 [Streptomyces sp. WM6372]|nr:hypothetical protein ADK52_19035 [Streptomyces sp. WM6372]
MSYSTFSAAAFDCDAACARIASATPVPMPASPARPDGCSSATMASPTPRNPRGRGAYAAAPPRSHPFDRARTTSYRSL